MLRLWNVERLRPAIPLLAVLVFHGCGSFTPQVVEPKQLERIETQSYPLVYVQAEFDEFGRVVGPRTDPAAARLYVWPTLANFAWASFEFRAPWPAPPYVPWEGSIYHVDQVALVGRGWHYYPEPGDTATLGQVTYLRAHTSIGHEITWFEDVLPDSVSPWWSWMEFETVRFVYEGGEWDSLGNRDTLGAATVLKGRAWFIVNGPRCRDTTWTEFALVHQDSSWVWPFN